MSGHDHGSKRDVRIDRLDIRIEIDRQGGESAFAELFTKYARRWQEAIERASVDRAFADSERCIGEQP